MNELSKSSKEIIQLAILKDQIKRLDFYSYLYLQIVSDNYALYLINKKELEEFPDLISNPEFIFSESYKNYEKLSFKKHHYAVIVITFAGMFLECLIWDYAVINGMSKKKLGEMGALKKWEVIPGIVNNKASIGSSAISLLDRLVKERNKIVHSKSKEITSEFIRNIEQYRNKKRLISIDEVCQCINSCTEGLKKIDTTDYWFFKDDFWDSYEKQKPHNPF